MFINLKTILHLPVFTESGAPLGKVRDAELDVDSHHVRHYRVSQGLINKDDYIITPAQIKTITAQKMIVDDAVSKVSATVTSKNISSTAAFGGVSARTQE